MSEQEATLMTEAATTTDAAASEPADQTTATGAEAEGQQQQATNEPAKSETETPQGAPEKYDEFKTPEGVSLDPVVIGKFSEVAKDLNLSQANAQKLLETMSPVIAKQQLAQVEALRAEWAESSKTDKEFGGANLNENIGAAKKALDAFASPELRTLLDQSGLGNHPEVIRFMVRAGKAISEDTLVKGGTTQGAVDPAKRLFPNQA